VDGILYHPIPFNPKRLSIKAFDFLPSFKCMVLVHVPSLHLLITQGKNLFGIIMQVDPFCFKNHWISFKMFSKESSI
jgi:hypothetical protein